MYTERKIEKDIWHEFVDLDYGEIPFHLQNEWIRKGKNIIINKLNFTPTIFIAPQYRYDNITLQALLNNDLKNFDSNKVDDFYVVDNDPLWYLNDHNFNQRMHISIEKAKKAAEKNKILIIETHIQFFNKNGIKYIENLINCLQKNYKIKFITLNYIYKSF